MHKFRKEEIHVTKKPCTICQKKKKKKNQYKLLYRNEIGINQPGLLSISVWCLKIFLKGALTWGSLPNFNFFKVNSKFFNEIVKFTSQIAWKQIFTTILAKVWELLVAGITAIVRF